MNQTYHANSQGDDPQDPLPPIEPGITPDDGEENAPDEQRPEDWRDPNEPDSEQPGRPVEDDPASSPS